MISSIDFKESLIYGRFHSYINIASKYAFLWAIFMERFNTAVKSVHWHGTAWHGMAWHGMARHGMVWHGMVWHGIASQPERGTVKETSNHLFITGCFKIYSTETEIPWRDKKVIFTSFRLQSKLQITAQPNFNFSKKDIFQTDETFV